MRAGLALALPMGIVGFVLGAGFVLLLRAAQSMDPLWDAQIGVIIAGINATIFFMLGMGAFSPSLAGHHVEAYYDDEKGEIIVEGLHEDHDEDEAAFIPESEAPRVLIGQVVRVTFWAIVLFGGLLAFVSLPWGPSLQISNDPNANTSAIGFFTFDLFGQEVVMSQLFALLAFTALLVLTLVAVGGAIGISLFNLSKGVAVTKAEGNRPLNMLPASTAPVAGLLTSGEDAEVGGAVVRPLTAGQRARRLVVLNLIAFALLYAPVHIGLGITGLAVGDFGYVISLAVTLVLTLLLINLFPKGRADDPNQMTLVGVGVVVLLAAWGVFTVLIGFVMDSATWLYVPAEPTRTFLPFLSAVFITPLVLHVVFDVPSQGLSLTQKIRSLFVPMVLVHVLYPVFYGAAIGLVLPGEPLRTVVTAINVVLITLLLLYTGEVLWCIGKFASWALGLLRGLPQFIGQK